HVLIAPLSIVLMRAMGTPPRQLQLSCNIGVDAKSSRFAGHAVEPCHVLPSGHRIVVRVGRPCLIRTHDMPGRLEVSNRSKRKTVSNHAERPNQHPRPIPAVVGHPCVTLTSPDCHGIEAKPLPPA